MKWPEVLTGSFFEGSKDGNDAQKTTVPRCPCPDLKTAKPLSEDKALFTKAATSENEHKKKKKVERQSSCAAQT